MRDYLLTTPSLDGVLYHESLVYEGLRRPDEVLRLMDGPAAKGRPKDQPDGIRDETPLGGRSEHEQKIVEQYFYDLYGIFMKKLSYFIVGSEPDPGEAIKLQAMLQEMIKIKKLMGTHNIGSAEVPPR